MYLHANLVLLSVITDIENEVCVFESCIYDYFKLIEKSKDPDHTGNSLFTEYNHPSRHQLKKILNELKSNTNADDSTRTRYVIKLIIIKYSKKGSRLPTEMTTDEEIEKQFWKFCTEVFESENKVLPVFDENTCSDYFIKSLK